GRRRDGPRERVSRCLPRPPPRPDRRRPPRDPHHGGGHWGGPPHKPLPAPREIRTTAGARGRAFTEALGAPSTPAFAARLAAEGVTLATDQRVEIALGTDAWLAEVAAWLG